MSEPEYNFAAWKSRVRQHDIPANTVTISKSGNLTISPDLFEAHFSLEFLGAEIFVDTTLKAIGLKPSNDGTANFLFRKVGTGKNKRLYTRKLIVINDIEPRRYPAKWSDKYKMVVFNYRTLTEQPKAGEQ